MSEPTVLIQYVTHQRAEHPQGTRIWTDGRVQRCAATNPPPGPTDLMERDRTLEWEDTKQLDSVQVDAIKDAIRRSGFFNLEPRLLINYCKEDPGTMIWTVNLDGQQWRVVVYDPRPKRSAALDTLSAELSAVLG